VPPSLAWRGKFICRPLLVKWLGKMRFLAGPGYHVVGDGSFIDGKFTGS